MPLLTDSNLTFGRAILKLPYTNPFLPERIAAEREALGSDFIEQAASWNVRVDTLGEHPNVHRLVERTEAFVRFVHGELARGAHATATEVEMYQDAVIYLLYYRYHTDLATHVATEARGDSAKFTCYRQFARDAEELLRFGDQALPTLQQLPFVFSAYYQIRRAFTHIFQNLVGASQAMIRLRAAVWQSIFTHDMRRYRRILYDRMGDVTTLVIGPSGTGKELVARAIGLSRYMPFDPQSLTFPHDAAGSFFALNLSALSPTLIESELFGHRRGSFTGATADRAGWLEVCPALGTVFLDEIGELDPAIQVKLLRVLQSRTFQRLGDTDDRTFAGKIIAATNRDLAAEMAAGTFRPDFYYRLCSDVIVTPTLREQLREDRAELRPLLVFLARRLVGDLAEEVADEVETWINQNLGPDYPWPGNVRELEQCVRNVLIRKEYRPPQQGNRTRQEALAAELLNGTLTADEVLCRYCTLVYAQTNSYEETARRLGIDRRTVKSRLDEALLEELRQG